MKYNYRKAKHETGIIFQGCKHCTYCNGKDTCVYQNQKIEWDYICDLFWDGVDINE